MFKSFGDEGMRKIIECVTVKKLQEEEMLFNVDDEIDGLYILNSGELIGRDKFTSNKKVYSADSVIGELSLLHYVSSN